MRTKERRGRIVCAAVSLAATRQSAVAYIHAAIAVFRYWNKSSRSMMNHSCGQPPPAVNVRIVLGRTQHSDIKWVHSSTGQRFGSGREGAHADASE